jgi:hypothetical protein
LLRTLLHIGYFTIHPQNWTAIQSRTPEALQDSRTRILKILNPTFLAERGSALPDRHLRTTKERWKDEGACDRKVLSELPLGRESRESKAKL